LMEDMEEIAIQFGYVTMFAAAFPLAPLMALLNNLLEVRTDGYKYLKGTNRPRYRGARGIGVWYEIMSVLGYLAVMTNAALIVFSHPALYALCGENLLLSFGVGVVIEHVLFVLKYVVDEVIPDIPTNVQEHIAQFNYVKEVLHDNTQIASALDDGDDTSEVGAFPNKSMSDIRNSPTLIGLTNNESANRNKHFASSDLEDVNLNAESGSQSSPRSGSGNGEAASSPNDLHFASFSASHPSAQPPE